MKPQPLSEGRLAALSLDLKNHRITIVDDRAYVHGSVDNAQVYEHEHVLGRPADISSRHAVRVTENGNHIASSILLAGGGPTTIHRHAAVVRDDVCAVAVGPFIAAVRIPTLELLWAAPTDPSTCVGVYLSNRHQCFISHGELEVARLSLEGKLVWLKAGADPFTNGFTMFDDEVRVVDWNYKEYVFDIETGRERSGFAKPRSRASRRNVRGLPRGFLCPECRMPSLAVTKSIELPGDARWHEISVRLLWCEACDFEAVGTFKEYRWGVEREDHGGYRAAPALRMRLSELIDQCPRNADQKCDCASCTRLGVKDEEGRWVWLRNAGAEVGERFALMRPQVGDRV